MSQESDSSADLDQHAGEAHASDQPSSDHFIFDYVTYEDDLPAGQRWSTWLDVEPLCRGPEPRPDWVVTSQGAIDTELGILKSGKEADVFLLDRTDRHDPAQSVVMAAKRYRTREHRSFQRSAMYTEGRSMRRSRDERAVKRKSAFGRDVAAAEWAVAEWSALRWSLGLAVPYPVQIDGTEILMEWITDRHGASAPRLAQTRPDSQTLESYFDQVRSALLTLVQAGLVHGDLSPYNILVADERLVIIDLPQLVDLAGNQQGFDLLLRDCTNLCRWFERRVVPPTPRSCSLSWWRTPSEKSPRVVAPVAALRNALYRDLHARRASRSKRPRRGPELIREATLSRWSWRCSTSCASHLT